MRNEDLANKHYVRWITLARLEGVGLSLRDMARQSGLTLRQVRTALANPAYQELRDAKLKLRVSVMDASFAADNEKMAAQIRELVPLAIAVYERALGDPNPNVALRAATEVLDRDNRFSRSATISVEHRISESELERARELARTLKAKQRIIDVTSSAPEGKKVPVVDLQYLPEPN